LPLFVVWCLFIFSFRAIARASVIITTPEKWDGVSRSWQTRDFVRDVTLIVIDEIHLLGEDRGPVREKKQFAKW
jgi:activating signal cointegrator complex subunit 3